MDEMYLSARKVARDRYRVGDLNSHGGTGFFSCHRPAFFAFASCSANSSWNVSSTSIVDSSLRNVFVSMDVREFLIYYGVNGHGEVKC